jgi:hypothetical protein
MDHLGTVFGLVGPVLTIIVGLYSAYQRASISRLNDKIENERNLREQWQKYIDGRINEILSSISRVDKEVTSDVDAWKQECRGNFNEWARGEHEFLMNLFGRLDDQISELFDKKVTKEVCDEKHRWNGADRRRDDRRDQNKKE